MERPQSPSASLATAYTSRSLFPQGPTFTLETFSRRDFNVKDFIESLSDNAGPASRKSGQMFKQAFDPRPLIRTFEHALSRLGDLSGELEGRETELSAAVRRAEAQHISNVNSLGRKLEHSIERFKNLDRTLNGPSNGVSNAADMGAKAAVEIGERLEELDRQRSRAQDARFLIQCWMEVSERGELFILEEMRRQASGERRIKCAQIARHLLKISQQLDPGSWGQANGHKSVHLANGNGTSGHTEQSDNSEGHHNTRVIIEKFRESLEKDLLEQFDDFYRRPDFDGMRECATVLQDFGDGASAIGLYVNQHQFFIDRSQLVTDEVAADSETWDLLADPDADPPGIEPSLQSLLDEVKVVVQDESSIIKQAFPYYETVLCRFLQRVFQQSIQQRLEMVLEKATRISTLAFLRSLQSAKGYLNSMVDDLKSHGLTEHPEPLSSQTALVLDQQLDDLFVPHFVGVPYVEREKRNLEELYTSLLFKFTVYHSRRRKGPTTFLASLAKSGSELLSSARDAYFERLESSDLAPQQKKMLLRVAGLKGTESARGQMEAEASIEDSMLSVQNAKRMLRWLAEAVGRSLELSGGPETPKDVSALLDLLLTHMSQLYVDVSLEAAIDAAIIQENAKNEPDLSYLENLSATVMIMHLMVTCINTVLIPLAASNTLVRRDMEKSTSIAVNAMEEKVNTLMQRTIDVSITWVGKLLAGQKKTDFRPREDSAGGADTWLEMLQTPTCLATFNFLKKVHNLALLALSPSPNLTSFLTEVAVNVRSLLLDHLKKFQVSAMGGIMVTKDISKYNELLRSWSLDASFQPSLEVLTEIGNIFVIGPDALRERIRAKQGAIGGVWEKGDLRSYILRREDANSVGVQAVLGAL